MTDTRTITLRRTSGPAGPVSYTTAWTADDGTFSTPASVTLPPDTDVPLPVRIDVKKPGAHSGLLSLHDPASGAVVFRTQATVVAPERPHVATGTVEITRALATMHQNAHYIHVPPGADALALELEVARGVLSATLLQAHGLVSTYYMPVHPMDIFSVGPGTYHLVMPNPDPGTWTLRLKNASVHFPAKLTLGPRDDALAEYTVRMRILDLDVAAKPQARTVSLDLHNRGAALTEPLIEAWQGSRRTHRAAFAANGVSNVIDIDVPPDAGSLILDLRRDGTSANVELFLYNCTTGQCFSYDVAFPAAESQRLVVRRPAPGRWVAAVNAAPFPRSRGGFVLDEIITTGVPTRRPSAAGRPTGAAWREAFDDLPPPSDIAGRTPVVVFEVIDSAAERREQVQPWNPHPRFVKLRDRPVALGTAIYVR